MPLYIEKINGDVNQPTHQLTDRANIVQSAFSKMENARQRFAKIFSLLGAIRAWSLNLCTAEFSHYDY